MAGAVLQNRPAEAKSAKKEAKAVAAASPNSSGSTDHKSDASVPEKAPSVSSSYDEYENPYIRDLSKNVRNIAKKLANASKIDPIIAQHKGKSLDELVALRIINPDQKAQQLKKPVLEEQLKGLQEQLTQLKKIDSDWRARVAVDKSELDKSLRDAHEQDEADAVAVAVGKAETRMEKKSRDDLLLLSLFLRLAAARRADAPSSKDDLDVALEGVLLQVYSGDETAVTTMRKVIDGTEDKALSVAGVETASTFAQVKAASLRSAESSGEPDSASAESSPAPHVDTDPTVAHAGMTEIDSFGETPPMSDNISTPPKPLSVQGPLANASAGDEAANAVARAQNSADDSADIPESQDWVAVNREEAVEAEQKMADMVPSWADDQPVYTPSQAQSQGSSPQEHGTSSEHNHCSHEAPRSRRGANGYGASDHSNNGYNSGYRGRGGPRGHRGPFRGSDGRGSPFRGSDGRGRGYGGGPRGGMPMRGGRARRGD